MNILVPYSTFSLSAACLHKNLLGRQKGDCLKIIRLIETKQDTNHPVFNLFNNNYQALYAYCDTIFQACDKRFYIDKHLPKLTYRSNYTRPPWLGDPLFHGCQRAWIGQRHPGLHPEWCNTAYEPRLYHPGWGL